MATLHVNIPDDLKAQFEQTFAGQNIDDLIGRMMREALEQARAELQQRRAQAVEELLVLRRQTPPVTNEEIQAARERGRP
jgi:Flp pilus assembly CpaF family ATPase